MAGSHRQVLREMIAEHLTGLKSPAELYPEMWHVN